MLDQLGLGSNFDAETCKSVFWLWTDTSPEILQKSILDSPLPSTFAYPKPHYPYTLNNMNLLDGVGYERCGTICYRIVSLLFA